MRNKSQTTKLLVFLASRYVFILTETRLQDSFIKFDTTHDQQINSEYARIVLLAR